MSPKPDPAASQVKGGAAPRSRLRGCLLAAGVAAALILVVIVVTILIVTARVRRFRDEFTDAAAEPVPVEMPAPPQARRLTRTFESLQRALSEGRAEVFELTDVELNHMVASVPAVRGARGKALFRIEGDLLKVQAGIPLGQVPGFQGRYLNGEFALDLRIDGDDMRIFIREASVRGTPLPPAIMDRLRKVNIAEQAMRNPEFRNQIQGIRSLRVQDGRLLVETGKAP